MFVDQAGEIIADIMTVNRSYASIPSASAILDTSNYTFQAITYGKDADGFRNHAHVIISPSSDGFIKVISYDTPSFSGYHTSATSLYLTDTYKLNPASPTPLDYRLELESTIPNYSSGIANLGHCLNSIISPTLSSVGHLVGCFPAASGTKFKILDTSNTLIYSGTLSGVYNLSSMMDASGFLKFINGNASYNLTINSQVGAASSLYGLGVIRIPGSNFPSDVDLKWILNKGDAGSLLLFGGVFHLGLWCLDVKEMLKQGYYPPYSFNTLNNIRKYKLFAKKTFNKDLLTISGNSAFKTLFVDGTFDNGISSMILTWKIRFA
jgi:hypothetical protein